MRSIGSRRGPFVLRAAIEQTARRRIESLHVPHDAAHDAAAGTEPSALTRDFFERVRDHVLPLMAPALDVDGAEVRWLATERFALWGLRASHGLVLAMDCADSPPVLAERVRRWMSCLRTRTAPGFLQRTWGRPVYGARAPQGGTDVDVVWATPGEWRRVVLAEDVRPSRWSLPPHWEDAEPARA